MACNEYELKYIFMYRYFLDDIIGTLSVFVNAIYNQPKFSNNWTSIRKKKQGLWEGRTCGSF